MALPQGPYEGLPGTSVPETPLAPVHQLHPQLDEGVFDLEQTPLPTFDVQIDSVKGPRRRRSLEVDGTRCYQREITFDDGTRREEILSLGRDDGAEVIAGSPAWWTRLDGGINLYTAHRLNALDYNAHFTGISQNMAHDLYRNAWDVNLVLDNAAEEYDLDTSVVKVQGDSNGAMTGTGTIAYADQFGREISDAFLVDPRIVQKLGKVDITKFLQHPEYPLKEIYCLGKQAVRIHRQGEVSLRELASTASLSREYLIGNLLLSRALFWGEFGHLVAHLPEDQQLRYYMFNHSIGNQKRQLLRIMRGSLGNARPNVTWETHTGTHLSIANPATIDAKTEHFSDAA